MKILCSCIGVQRVLSIFINMLFSQVVGNGKFEIRPIFFQSYHRTLIDGHCCEQREDGKNYVYQNYDEKSYPKFAPCKRPCNVQFEICIKNTNISTVKNDKNRPEFYYLRECNILSYVSKPLGYHDVVIYDVPFDANQDEKAKTYLAKLKRTLFRNATRKKSIVESVPLLSGRFTSKKSSHIRIYAEVSQSIRGPVKHPIPILNESWFDILPRNNKWRNVILESKVGRAYMQFRIVCEEGMHGDFCDIPMTCPANQSLIKHGRCINGSLSCDESFTGKYCDQALCRNGCQYGTGRCLEPGYCACVSGWRGKRCTECKKDSYCKASNSICTKEQICVCKYGWTGYQCQLDVFMCSGKKGREWCNNRGTCVFPLANVDGGPNKPNRCRCDIGFTGDFCDKEDNICLETHFPHCRNGGKCVKTYGFQGECICPHGYVGRNCEINLSRCSSNPCVNAFNCTDTTYDYICHCKKGWEGKNCERDTKECFGQCASNAECIEGRGSYYCRCGQGWEGVHCDIKIDYCASSPCQHGVCVNQESGGYKCVCSAKYTGTHCDHNLCLNSSHHVVCQIDSNICASQSCSGNGQCLIHASDGSNSYKCICNAGYTGKDCERRIDYCASKPCLHGTCVNGLYSYTCNCKDCCHGRNCFTPKDACRNVKCLNGGICNNLQTIYTCVCTDAFWGKHCEFGPNICKNKNPCRNGGICNSSPRNYTCTCKPGFSGRDCQIVDSGFCDLQPCGPRGKCINKKNDFECECLPGYRGKYCHLRDHCIGWPCFNGGTCMHDGDNDFICKCPPQYYGKTCDSYEDSCWRVISRVDRPEFTTLVPAHSCTSNGVCVSLSRDKYHCRCKAGWMGERCETKTDYCEENKCENNAICLNDELTYDCSCKSGFQGRYCEKKINKCDGIVCQNNGTCQPITNDFICNCQKGWKGKLCESIANPCEGNPCSNGGHCVAKGGSFECICPTEYRGRTCAELASPCQSHTCRNGGTCWTSKTTFMECICKNGYTGDYCEIDIDDCSSNPCLNGGQCIDHVGWHECKCSKGFFGVNCQYEVNECLSSPCKNGGECVNEIGGYTCECEAGHVGRNCSEIRSYESCNLGNGVIRKHADTWMVDCNQCFCTDGNAHCTNRSCGSFNCLENKHSNANTSCNCIEVNAECITPPCRPWGECGPIATAVSNPECSLSTKAEELSYSCVHLNIHFNKSYLPEGITVREICNAYKRVHEVNYAQRSDNIELECGYEFTNATQQKLIISVYNANASASKVAQILAKTPNNYENNENYRVLRNLKEATLYTEINRAIVYHKLKVVQENKRYLTVAIIVFFVVLIIVIAIFIVVFIRKKREDSLSNTKPVERHQNDLRGTQTDNLPKKANLKLCQSLSVTTLPSIPERDDEFALSTSSGSRNTVTQSDSSCSSNISELVKRLPKPGTSPPLHSPVFSEIC